jgi:hypothetical protein
MIATTPLLWKRKSKALSLVSSGVANQQMGHLGTFLMQNRRGVDFCTVATIRLSLAYVCREMDRSNDVVAYTLRDIRGNRPVKSSQAGCLGTIKS